MKFQQIANKIFQRSFSKSQPNVNKIFSAATTASSDFRKILYVRQRENGEEGGVTSLVSHSTPLAFLVKPADLKSALDPLKESIDTEDYIEPTLKSLLNLSFQSKPQINKFNNAAARAFFSRSTNDTGSVEVQCGQLTARIIWLGEHCAAHKHDYTAQRKIVELVAIRRKFLKYLRNTSLHRFYHLLDQLSLPPNYLDAFEASCSYKAKQLQQKHLKLRQQQKKK